MPLGDAAKSVRPATPPCLICRNTLNVRELKRPTQADERVRYWTCDACAASWPTHDRPPIADRIPRLSRP
jgi:hypothetical protein